MPSNDALGRSSLANIALQWSDRSGVPFAFIVLRHSDMPSIIDGRMSQATTSLFPDQRKADGIPSKPATNLEQTFAVKIT